MFMIIEVSRSRNLDICRCLGRQNFVARVASKEGIAVIDETEKAVVGGAASAAEQPRDSRGDEHVA